MFSNDLTSDEANMIYIPEGLAHGFYTLSESAILVYKTSTVYDPNYDSGILWSSLGIAWPSQNPIISERDMKQVPFNDFDTPFVFSRGK